MQDAGYEVNHGKYISFRATGQERFTRAKTIGDNYTEERIRERISQPKMQQVPRWIKPSVDKIIDRSDTRIASSPAYRQWAGLHNLHAMADSFNYLAEHFNTSFAEMERHYADCIARRDAVQSAFDESAKKIAADKSIGVADKLKQHSVLKSRHAKEMAALNTELAEMNRIRQNFIATHGEDFYR